MTWYTGSDVARTAAAMFDVIFARLKFGRNL